MVTDRTSNVAGDLSSGRFGISCILEEGALTAGEGYNPNGQKVAIATPAAPIAVDDLVYLIPGEKNLGAETNLDPVVAKLATGTVYAGIVTSTPRWVYVPTESMAFTDCDNADWATILAGKYYRKATVEFFGVTGAFAGTVTADGSNEVDIGAIGDLKWDVTLGTFIPVANGGTGLLPMHYVPTGSSGDTYTIMIGVLATSIVVITS
jgi:hypothetical protein